MFRVYFGKYRAVWFAVYKYGGTNTVDKKPQWYLPMHALLKEHLITNYSTVQVNLANYQAHKHKKYGYQLFKDKVVTQVVVKANVLKGTETFFLFNLKVLCMPP